MKKILIVITVCVAALALAGCMAGSKADVTLSYTRYPEDSFNHVKSVAVLPFQEGGTLASESVLERTGSTNQISLLIASDLSNKLAERKLFRVFDHSIGRDEPSVEMVISGLITENGMGERVQAYETKLQSVFGVNPKVVEGNSSNYNYFDGTVYGRLAVNYRFVDPKTGEVLRMVNLEKEYSKRVLGDGIKEVRSKLPDRSTVRKQLINQINNEFISTFTPTEINADFALATLKGNKQFTNSLVAVKNGNWARAVEIWDFFEQTNVVEAFYNKMLYIRYIQQDLDEAIRYTKEAQERTGDNSFNSWITKFEKEKELELKYKNSITVDE